MEETIALENLEPGNSYIFCLYSGDSLVARFRECWGSVVEVYKGIEGWTSVTLLEKQEIKAIYQV